MKEEKAKEKMKEERTKEKMKEERTKEKMKEERMREKVKEEKAKERMKEEKKGKGGGGGGGEEKAKWRVSTTEEKKRHKSKDREKTKKKSGSVEVLAAKKPEPVFGVQLADAVARSKLYDNIELPRVVRECIDYVEEFGLTTPGIYRLSGVKSKVDALKIQYDAGERVNITDYDPTIITSLLKQYLRELPETVLTSRLTPAFEHSAGLPTTEEKVGTFKKILAQLPKCNYTLLSWVMVHLGHILERKDQTKMTIQNLSIVMSPTMRISHRTMNVLFVHWKNLFHSTKLKKCPKPLEWIPGSVFEVPETTGEIEDELLRHEAILAKMHEELNQGVADKSTEDDLWEVQRVVTQLKRKLRVSRRVSETRLAAKEKEMETKEPKAASGAVATAGAAGGGSKERSPAKIVSLPPSAIETDVPSGEEKKPEEPKEVIKEEPPEVDASKGVPEAEAETEVEAAEGKPKVEEEGEQKEERTDEKAEDTDKVSETGGEGEPDLEMMKLLLLSQAEVVVEREELTNIRNDLQKRIEAEREEIARLQSAIFEAQQSARHRGASVDSLDSSGVSESSSSESEDEEELQKILEGLIRENEELKRKNMQLSHNIHNEREACAELRVQINLQEQMPQLLKTLAQAGLKKILQQPQTGLKYAPPQAPTGLQNAPDEGAKSEGHEEQSVGEKKEGSRDNTSHKQQKKVAVVTEPLPDKPPENVTPSADSRASGTVEVVKNENTNSNASPGDPEDGVAVESDAVTVGSDVDDSGRDQVAGGRSIVSERRQQVPRRHIEETAL